MKHLVIIHSHNTYLIMKIRQIYLPLLNCSEQLFSPNFDNVSFEIQSTYMVGQKVRWSYAVASLSRQKVLQISELEQGNHNDGEI